MPEMTLEILLAIVVALELVVILRLAWLLSRKSRGRVFTRVTDGPSESKHWTGCSVRYMIT
jgi:hypothetical protein